MAHSSASVSPPKPGKTGGLGEGGLWGPGPGPELDWIAEPPLLTEASPPSPFPALTCRPQNPVFYRRP